MVMALFGNVITAFSWFGVNMLGVGLHSYGFMDKAFPWLAALHGEPGDPDVRRRSPLESVAQFSGPLECFVKPGNGGTK